MESWSFSNQTSPVRIRDELWAAPLLIMSGLNLLIIASFEMFVLYKAYGTNPSRRHLFLGQMLLLGLMLSSGMGLAFVCLPGMLSCTVLRLGVGVCYALIFSTLLVKCVFLISLHSGVYLPPSYQGLLLFFAVLVQTLVGVQWTIQFQPPITPTLGGLAACGITFSEYMYSLIYVMFLLCGIAGLSLRVKTLRENHREGMFITIAVFISIPIWIAWVGVGLALEQRHQDACVAFGLVCNALVVFLVMFLPKGRQLAAMGREGLYPEDREEFSPYQSIYTPSFLHVKPMPPSNQETLVKPYFTSSSGEGLFYLPSRTSWQQPRYYLHPKARPQQYFPSGFKFFSGPLY